MQMGVTMPVTVCACNYCTWIEAETPTVFRNFRNAKSDTLLSVVWLECEYSMAFNACRRLAKRC